MAITPALQTLPYDPRTAKTPVPLPYDPNTAKAPRMLSANGGVTPAPMSANQTAYLNGLVKAGGGNAEWAKSQLGAVPQPSATSTPKPLVLNNNDGKGGLSQAQLTAMGEGIKSLGSNFGTAATPPPAIPKPRGTFNLLGKAGDGTIDTTSDVTPVAATNTTPAPMSQGSFPGQLTNAQIAAEAQARIDKQRAAITGATNAANAARKNVFDYTNQITGDSRTLENGAFNETHNPFAGQTGYAQANLQRNRSIEDTANNNNYQADITANNQKLTDFETLAPEQQQSILDDLTRQEREYGIQEGTLTGNLNGQRTIAGQTLDNNQANADRTFNYNAGQDTIANNRNAANDTANYTGNYTSPQNVAIQQQMEKNSAAYASASPAEQQRLHDENLALGKQLGQTYDPNTGTYSGGNGSVRTIAGQTLDMNNAKDMATLTGYISDGKGGYMPTNEKQQQDLSNAWTATNNLGRVTPELSKLTGIAVGTPTQQAINQSQQIAVSNRNATNSENGTSNSNNNAKINQLMEVWKATGKAPAGIPGVAVDTPYGQTPPKYSTVEDFSKFVDNTPLVSNVGGIKTVTDPVAMENAILNSGMSETEMVKAYNAYKIPLKKK